MRPTVTTEAAVAPAEKIEYQRALLKPRPTPPRVGPYYQRLTSPQDIPHILRSASASTYLAVDLETKGTDYSWNYQPTDPAGQSVEIIGIGLAWDKGSAYIAWNEIYTGLRQQILDTLSRHRGLLAHNVYFDGGVLLTLEGPPLHWHACTLALYRLLSNEGWSGQMHGLKSAMTDILQWEDTNETGIDTWLVANGYYKGNQRKDTDPETLVQAYHEGTLRPEKGEMWRVPHEILGPYCILDVEATYLLYTEHLLPALRKFPELQLDFQDNWMRLIDLHIQQRVCGIEMDVEALHEKREQLLATMSDLELRFRTMPEVAPHIEVMEQNLLAVLAAKEPERYKKLPERPKEPPRFKKNGQQSKNWETWIANEGKYTVPVQSLTWVAWQERWTRAVRGEDESYLFNIQSGKQLGELLYDRMGNEVRIRTESGQYGTGSDALAHMGGPGKILIERDNALKELGFIEKYLELCELRPSIHPSFSVPGTSTGRLSSKEPNLQQVKKTKAMMELFGTIPGWSLVDIDFRALENVVAAELSECPNLYNLYGDDVPENDAHLFLAAHIDAWKSDIAATGYTPYAPRAGTVAKAKKEVKGHRNKAKTVVYACQYGGGVQKIFDTLTNNGVAITFDEVKTLHTTYWDLFKRMKTYGYELQDQWWSTVDLPDRTKAMYRDWSRRKEKRDQIPKYLAGYVMNGLGRPMCINYHYLKDVLSRVLQSTGHDILILYIHLVTGELEKRRIPWRPWIVDLHDAMTVATPDEYVGVVAEIYGWAMDELNRILLGKIRHGGTPTMGKTMSDIKEPEE